MNDNDNIILFPTNRIKDKQNVGKNIDEREHRKIVEKQTKEFVEGNVDEIAYSLLDRFCLLYTSPSPRDRISSRMPSSA